MSSLATIKTQIQTLITLANDKTGKSDTTLTDCVNSLIAGYGQSTEPSEPTPTYTNQIPLATDSTGAIYGADYNGDGKNDGYKEQTRIGSDGTDRTYANTDATGFIPCTFGQTVYFKNCEVVNGQSLDYQDFSMYDTNKTFLGTANLSTLDVAYVPFTVDENGYILSLPTSYFSSKYHVMAYVRISCQHLGVDSIITVDEPIE